MAGPLGLQGGAFKPPEKNTKTPGGAAELERQQEPATAPPPPPAPIEWDPEKAALIVRGAGGILHMLDPIADTALAPDLWRATEADVQAIGPPLARIMNRYATARELAGYSDEVGLGMAALPYMKRNLAERGRARANLRELAELQPGQPAAAAPTVPPMVATLVTEGGIEVPGHLAEPQVTEAAETGVTGDDLGMMGGLGGPRSLPDLDAEPEPE